MPLSCQNTRTHKRTGPDAGLRGSTGGVARHYSRIYLPADGSANVSFVADDNSRQPEIYLSLQLHGGIGHVSVHARSEAARETCSGALGFDVRARSSPRERDHAADDRGGAGDPLPAAALGVVARADHRADQDRDLARGRDVGHAREPRREQDERVGERREHADRGDDAAVVAQQQPHARGRAGRRG